MPLAVWVEMFRKQLYLSLRKELNAKSIDFGYTCKELMIKVLVDYYNCSSLDELESSEREKNYKLAFELVQV